jgi:predicted AAA+ superfamily ATPase
MKIKEIFNDPKNSATSGSFIGNIPDDIDQRIRRSNTYNIYVSKKNEKNYILLDELQNLKK